MKLGHLLLSAVALTACSSEPTPPPQAPASDPQPVTTTAAPDPTTPAVTAAVTTPPTASAAAPVSTRGGTASVVAPAAVSALDPVVIGLAPKEAPGAKPEGTMFAGQFTEGQLLEQAFTMQPGKCYTVLGVSLGNVTELDIQVQIQAPSMPPLVAFQDASTGPTAVAGGKATGCFTPPVPIATPAKIVLVVAKGDGLAVAKVYVK